MYRYNNIEYVLDIHQNYLNALLLIFKDLLPAANLLQLDYIKDACVKFLQTQLDPSNCLGIRAFADLHNCLELSTSSEAYIRRNFQYDESN